jgi:hypothetical protein
MGFAGRTTSTALIYIMDIVRKAWMHNKEASMLSLDMTGAYNNVDRSILLKNMQDRGVPEWLTGFTWSFLSNRTTTIRIPGYTSEPFEVSTGIPQGSPFSPILFLFSTATLLDQFVDEKDTFIVSYVDDTYILATSASISTNNVLLAKAHKK